MSAGQEGFGQPSLPDATPKEVSWKLPDKGLSVRAVKQGTRLTLHFTSDKPGTITWPVIPADDTIKGYILPKFEGIYAPTADAEWMDQLIDFSPMDTTAELSMPFIGLALDGKTLTYIFENMFDNQLVFERVEVGGMCHQRGPRADRAY